MDIKTSKIVAFLSIFSLGIVFPLQITKSLLFTLIFALVLFIAGLFTPFSIQHGSLFNHFEIKSPKWSDQLSQKKPLTYSHFFGYLMLSGGAGEIAGQLIFMKTASFFGFGLFALGFGMLIGNLLALKFPYMDNAK